MDIKAAKDVHFYGKHRENFSRLFMINITSIYAVSLVYVNFMNKTWFKY